MNIDWGARFTRCEAVKFNMPVDVGLCEKLGEREGGDGGHGPSCFSHPLPMPMSWLTIIMPQVQCTNVMRMPHRVPIIRQTMGGGGGGGRETPQ